MGSSCGPSFLLCTYVQGASERARVLAPVTGRSDCNNPTTSWQHLSVCVELVEPFFVTFHTLELIFFPNCSALTVQLIKLRWKN